MPTHRFPKQTIKLLQDKIPGEADRDLEQFLGEVLDSLPAGGFRSRSPRPQESGAQTPIDRFEAISAVLQADANHDPEVVQLRRLPRELRIRLLGLCFRESLRGCYGLPIPDAHRLVLQHMYRMANDAELPAKLRDATRVVERVARKASEEFGVQLEYATMFALFPEAYRLTPLVEASLKRHAEKSCLSRIHLSVDPGASPKEVAAAYAEARRQLIGGGRAARDKALALAAFLARYVCLPEDHTDGVDWKILLLLWNRECELNGWNRWQYSRGGARREHEVVYQFARDAKKAIESVRGARTEFGITGRQER